MTKNTIIFIILITFLAFIAVKTEAACPFVTIGLSRGYYDEPTQEVFALQRFLARDKNIYPEGLVTGYFGKLTEAALKRFQTKNGLSPTGIVDEKTKEILCNKYVQCPFVTDMKKGDFEEKNEEVKELQKLLKQDKSIYPEGLVTGYFGRLTEAALKRFQERYGISVTGEVNSKTREKLCDIYVYGWKEKISQVTTTTTNINQLPDLLIGDISYIPSYPKVGETVTFKAKVKNIGLQNASSHLFQISRANQTIFSTYLTLNAQETKEVSFYWDCPSGAAGDYEFEANIDAQNNILESNENNNKTTFSICCGCGPLTKPNLIITDVFLTRPFIKNDTEKRKIEITLKNIGETAALFERYSNYNKGLSVLIYIPGQENTYYQLFDRVCLASLLPGLIESSDKPDSYFLPVGNSVIITISLDNLSLIQELVKSAGEKTLGFKIDALNEIDESNENDNNYLLPIIVKESGFPDLVISSLYTSPASGVPGQGVYVYITEKNQGDASARGHRIDLYIDGYLVNSYPVSSFNSGASWTAPAYYYICPSGGGLHIIRALTDLQDEVLELNENNNTANYTLSCGTSVTQLPDLIISDFSVQKTTINVGEEVTATALIKNIGNETAYNFESSILPLSSSGINVFFSSSNAQTSALSPGYSYYIYATIKCEQAGKYQIRAVADSLGKVKELNDDNNYQTLTVECISPSLPDLIITTINITPTNPKEGDYVNFVITEKNIGNASADRHYIGWYQNNSLMGASLVYGLAPNATTNYSFSMQYNEKGTFSIKAKADVYNTVSESNETNNESFSSLTVSSGYIYPSQTGCVKSPAYNGDSCSGYRLIRSLDYSSACYSLDQCLAVQGDGTCVKSPVYQGDLCSGYRLMPGISRACYSYSECLNALNQSSALELIQKQLVQIETMIRQLIAGIGLLSR